MEAISDPAFAMSVLTLLVATVTLVVTILLYVAARRDRREREEQRYREEIAEGIRHAPPQPKINQWKVAAQVIVRLPPDLHGRAWPILQDALAATVGEQNFVAVAMTQRFDRQHRSISGQVSDDDLRALRILAASGMKVSPAWFEDSGTS